ncbi:LOW QUALITY PROTEIN: leukocyte receptor cluster member 8 [Taeniopygia guttata]|uniref:LOW QUALITY PROTEIN: leukocyte receptor cluster member 8 n=1 Tax=Taeniopygia guttata TaxID=59729 RepID=UPI003BB94BDE
MAANLGEQREWAAPFGAAAAAREEAAAPAENPEWEKARQALASISKAAAAGAAGGGGGGGGKAAAAAAGGGQGGAQYAPPGQGDPSVAQPPQYYPWYQPYGGGYYPYGYYYPMQGVYPGYGAPPAPYPTGGGGGSYAPPQQPQPPPPAPPQPQSGLAQQPPVPGLEEPSPFGTPQPPPAAPPQPPPHAGGGGATPPGGSAPYPSPHYGEGPPPKGKKGGGQLWSRMKQAPGSGGLKFQLPKRAPFALPPPGFGGPSGPEKLHGGHGESRGSVGRGRPEDWPPEMKAYVQRCFTACESEEDKDRTEKLLKELLQARLQDGSAFTIDWSREPLPGLGREGTTSPKKKRWELPPSRAGPAGPGPPQNPQNAQNSPQNASGRPPQNPPRGGGRPRGGPGGFPGGKFGNRNVFVPEHSSSSSGSRSRSSSRSPGRPCRRSDSDSDSGSGPELPVLPVCPVCSLPAVTQTLTRARGPSSQCSQCSQFAQFVLPRSDSDSDSGSGPELRPGGRRAGPQKPRGRGGPLERGRARGQRGKRPEPCPPRRGRRRPPPEPEDGDRDRDVRRQRRAQRFQGGLGGSGGAGTPKKPRPNPPPAPPPPPGPSPAGDTDWEQLKVSGTCQEVTKRYLRLTCAPDPSTVRPVPVLRQALALVRSHWAEHRDYAWACEQLKSLRQDLTVQGVRTEFTVEVYETHARIALEKGDHEEFNQCQTQLKALYGESLAGCEGEFTAYRILYCLFTNSSGELTTELALLPPNLRSDPAVTHALAVRAAWALGLYSRFFRLQRSAPAMGPRLIDLFAERERRRALRAFLKAFRPALPTAQLGPLVGLEPPERRRFLGGLPLTYTGPDRGAIDCRQSLPALPHI